MSIIYEKCKRLAGEVSVKTKKGLVKLMNSLARPFLFALMLAVLKPFIGDLVK